MKSGILGKPGWSFCGFLVRYARSLASSAGVLQPPQQVQRHAQDDKLLLSVSEWVSCVCALSIFLTPGIGFHLPCDPEGEEATIEKGAEHLILVK